MGNMDMFSIKSVDSIVNAVIDTGDSLVYTDEERAKVEQLKRDTKLSMIKNFEPYKLAQRYIALLFTANFLLAFWVGVLLFLSDFKFDGYIKLVNAFNIGWIMLAIISFYFTDGAMSWFKGRKK